jgi:flagellar biosynthesis/type III secretory pathway chaperone
MAEAGMPGPAFDDLLTNLERQGALYDDLIVLSERERAAIEHADLATLAAIVARKESIVREAQALETDRMDLFRRLAALQRAPVPITGADMRALATSPEHAERFEAARVTLSERVTRLRRVNARNAHLIVQARRMTEHVLAAAMRHARNPMYSAQGEQVPEARPSIVLDVRA